MMLFQLFCSAGLYKKFYRHYDPVKNTPLYLHFFTLSTLKYYATFVCVKTRLPVVNNNWFSKWKYFVTQKKLFDIIFAVFVPIPLFRCCSYIKFVTVA